MRTLGLIEPQMLIVAAFSRHTSALEWARQQLEQCFGPIALTGPDLPFTGTRYYERAMGTDLRKHFYAFTTLQDPDQLAAVKRRALDLERELMDARQYTEPRPLNLDPGFLGLGKLVLATTKDQAHRIYLHGGIFAEVTLGYHDGAFVPQSWTYPDWQHPEVLAFLQQARHLFVQRRTESGHSQVLPRLLTSDL